MGSSVSIAIVGAAGRFPALPGEENATSVAELDRFWRVVREGRSVIRPVPPGRWRLDPAEIYDPEIAAPDRVYSLHGAFLESLPEACEMADRWGGLEALDPSVWLALLVGAEAFRAGVTDALDRRRVGVILGNIALPTENASQLAREVLAPVLEARALAAIGRRAEHSVPAPDDLARRLTAHPLSLCVPSLPATLLARALGLGLGGYTLDAACASSLYALNLAADELTSGRADAMLAGGLSRPDCLYTQMGFSQLRALSPTGVCAPFDARGDGLVVGEGAGIFLLKRTEDALRDGDAILALLRGFGLSNDIGGSLLAPISEGQLRAMRPAYDAAGWRPGDVDLVECHATGTPVGDAVEFESLQALWNSGDAPRGRCVIGSVKSNVGHLLTGAGAAATMKVLLALHHETLPPTANFARPPAAIHLDASPFRVLSRAEAWPRRDAATPRRAALNAFGFGGIDAHVLVEEWVGQVSLPARPVPGADLVRRENRPAPVVAGDAIAIVGMDAAFGRWNDLRAFQERVFGGGMAEGPEAATGWWGVSDGATNGQTGPQDPRWRGYYARDLEVPMSRFRIPPRELEEMLPQQILMLQTALGAMNDAHQKSPDPLRTGVFIGAGLDPNTTNFCLRWDLQDLARGWSDRLGLDFSPAQLAEWVQDLRRAAGPALNANRVMGALAGVIASRVARELRVGGPSFTLASEETSGLRAVDLAVRALRSRSLDLALAGAVDLAGDLRVVLAERTAGRLSPSGAALPFDERADGALPGEGAAALVLKRHADALRDGDRVYAVIRGVSVAGGTQPADATEPDGDAISRSLERALAESGVAPEAIGYVESGTPPIAAVQRVELDCLAQALGAGRPPRSCVLGSAQGDVGHAGGAAGLAALVKASLCLYQEILPAVGDVARPLPEIAGDDSPFSLLRRPEYWLRNRAEGLRHALVGCVARDGSCSHIVLEEAPQPEDAWFQTERLQPLGARREALFAIEANNVPALMVGLGRLRAHAQHYPACPIEQLARLWWHANREEPGKRLGLALVARTPEELLDQIALTQHALVETPERRLGGGDSALGDALPRAELLARDRLFFSPDPLGPKGEVGFIYPGSGNQFSDMGRDMALEWPEVLRLQDSQNRSLCEQFQPGAFWRLAPGQEVGADYRTLIFGQVAVGAALTDLIRSFGVRPGAVIGYSLGESAGLFSLRAWTGRDLMLQRMHESTLFTTDLAGRCDAVRRAWKLPASKTVDWVLGVIDRPAKVVRAALKDHMKVYRLIVNTLHECVIGGDRKAVERLVKKLECEFFPLKGVSTVHCEIAKEVEQPYRELHLLETSAPRDVRFYSGAWGTTYHVNRESAADSIVAQAIYGIDYPKVINAAYDDGVRVFVEMGPGASCTRMIGEILGERPHVARPVCVAGQDTVSMVLRLLAQLIAERVPVDLSVLYGQETFVVGHREVAESNRARALTLPVGHALGHFPGVEELAPPAELEPAAEPEREPAVAAAAPHARVASVSSQPQSVARPALAEAPVPGEAPASVPAKPIGAFLKNVAQPPSAVKPFNLESPNSSVFTAEGGYATSRGPSPGQALAVASPAAATLDAATPAADLGAAGSLAATLAGLARRVQQAETAKIQAHETFLRFTNRVTETLSSQLRFQMALLERAAGIVPGALSAPDCGAGVSPASCVVGLRPASATSSHVVAAPPPAPAIPAPLPVPLVAPIPFLDRAQCLEFARGSIARVLGPVFAPVDALATRVRLPDEPLMLVDRILSVEGPMARLADPAVPFSSVSGRVVTEHDVRPDWWYLDAGKLAACVAIEAGQADLFLSGYLGTDFLTRGLAMYRLLDAEVTLRRDLPGPGETIRYDIRIERFFRQGETLLFRFGFEGTIGGEPFLTMRDGCAGFFTQQQLEDGQGVVLTEADRLPRPGVRPADWEDFVPMTTESLDDRRVAALRRGDLAGCFGPLFEGLALRHPVGLPSGEPPAGAPAPQGQLRLVDRVLELDPHGGRYGLGLIRAETDIHPDDWFLTCHFVDDRVMPGTLMYECCQHTLRIFLLRMGWVGECDEVTFEPVLGVASRLRCRGQVRANSRRVVYEVAIKELGYGGPHGPADPDGGETPYALADVLMYSDGKMAVDIRDMSVRLVGQTRSRLRALWRERFALAHRVPTSAARVQEDNRPPEGGTTYKEPLQPGSLYVVPALAGQLPTDDLPPDSRGTALTADGPAYGYDRILAFATGKPSDGYGERYRIFDDGRRKLARLPRPPYQFLDRVMAVEGAPWKMAAGVEARAEYDVPPDAWYFAADGAPADARDAAIPHSILLEVALQSCGWIAAYMGSALTSDSPLLFRNLGGRAMQMAAAGASAGTLAVRARVTRVSATAGMIIQQYEFDVQRAESLALVYHGEAQFGFFSEESLSQQVGIRDAKPYEPTPAEVARGRAFAFPVVAPFPPEGRFEGPCTRHLTPAGRTLLPPDLSAHLRMVDTVDLFVPDGGPHGLGFVRGSKQVDPAEWFFQAHFLGDPVWPGSLGVEAFLQVLKVAAAHRWGRGSGGPWRFESPALGVEHHWTYRGQVTPDCRLVTVEAVVTEVDDERRLVRGDGYLSVDGKVIYDMRGYAVRLT